MSKLSHFPLCSHEIFQGRELRSVISFAFLGVISQGVNEISGGTTLV
jgi:hypothetical protein